MNYLAGTVKASSLILAAISVFATAAIQAQNLPENNTAKVLARAADLGPVAADKDQVLTVLLKLHNQAAYDQAVQELYDPGSPTFHQWFSKADFEKVCANCSGAYDRKTRAGEAGPECRLD